MQTYLGQHTMAVSPGPRASKKMSSAGSKKSSYEADELKLNAPEMLVDVGLSLAAVPTVAQPEGQMSPGE